MRRAEAGHATWWVLILVVSEIAACASKPEATPAVTALEPSRRNADAAPVSVASCVPWQEEARRVLGDLPCVPWSETDAQREPEAQHALLAVRDALAIPMPRCAGSESYQAWQTEKLAPWMQERTQRHVLAARELDELSEREAPVPTISAVSRAVMFEHLAVEFVSAPYPDVITTDEDMAVYRQGLIEATASWVRSARTAYEYCANHRAGPFATTWANLCRDRLATFDRRIASTASAGPCATQATAAEPSSGVVGIVHEAD